MNMTFEYRIVPLKLGVDDVPRQHRRSTTRNLYDGNKDSYAEG